MLKVDRIISVSSEDPAHPAENLLKNDSKNIKWKCKSSGEKSASIVMQFEKASKIKSIDVGNENSAFIEILVGKSCLPDDNFKVLVVASSLMTLKEAKDLSNANGVRFFKEANFCKPEANEKWDRVKIVCSQPYNKHTQYGLSFIKFHGDNGDIFSSTVPPASQSSENKVSALGKFLLKEEKDDDIVAGSIFARRKELQDTEKTSATAIRAATSQLLSKSDDDKPAKSPYTKPTSYNKDNSAKKNWAGKRNKPQEDEDDKPEVKKTKKVVTSNSDVGPPSRDFTFANQPKILRTPPPPPIVRKQYKPFCEFFRGVVFTISGFQNPLRGNIRSKGLEMGARYKPDWDSTCTHLICAFANTPKFNQVQGVGKIVKKEWIEESYSKRIRLPWRRFALDPSDAKKGESEDEIFEGDESQNNVASTSSNGFGDPLVNHHQPGPSLFGDLPKMNAQKKKDQSEEQKSPSPKKRTPKKTQNQIPDLSPVKNKGRPKIDEPNEQNSPSPKGRSPKKAQNQTLALSPVGKKNISPKNNLNKGRWENNYTHGNNQMNGTSKSVYLDLDLEEVEGDSVQDLPDTESDQEEMNETAEDDEASTSLPYLPEQFDDLSFYVADDFLPSVATKIKRYVVAHNGSVKEKCTQDTEYVIADKSSTVNELKEDFPEIIGVKAEWVWRCHDENRLLPTSNYEL